MTPLRATAIFAFLLSSFVGLGAALGTTDYAAGPAEGGYGVRHELPRETAAIPVPTLRLGSYEVASR